MGKPFLIATASDEKSGNFLVNNWFISLRKNVNLSMIDVLILDYGLNPAQKLLLEQERVILKECKKNGLVANLRFKDLLDFLNENFYEQILLCDGGDIIFQGDISHLFLKDRKTFRVTYENTPPFFYFFLNKRRLKKDVLVNIRKQLPYLTKTINAGFILAPYEKMKLLCKEVILMTNDWSKLWIDQIVTNYILNKEGFVELPEEYNFTLGTRSNSFKIKDDLFYTIDGNLIYVVHNTGLVDLFRIIKNFGTGKNKNRVKPIISRIIYLFFSILRLINLIILKLNKLL